MAKVDYATLKKGGFMRQKQKNNFSLRLACVGGTLTAENLKKIAEVAEKYGDGYVHLTSRQGVEIPFIKLDDIDDVRMILQKADASLVSADRESVQLQPARATLSVQAEISTAMTLR